MSWLRGLGDCILSSIRRGRGVVRVVVGMEVKGGLLTGKVIVWIDFLDEGLSAVGREC